ncbi:Glycoside hydrolase, subgroup, catalytic core [Metarhizium album ARSEF 1941]|uniref:chitinase n=1 Tax=Metarhizium album (strain ARSEF 1941) TaxID=1081103 RepID=A0A0B2WWG7_METAS|nr:Glycoside hydrolase, subgroup, catalytic core [Metarhizium album ARSEF 1941]KHN98408.1 Glycoside hydrolase, subgroup, catalytic core [Metarhizium album ARSEF 1941]
MKLLTRALAVSAAPLFAQVSANPYDALPSSVSLVPYDSVPHPGLDSQAAVDAYLEEWTAANDRTPASAERKCPPPCTESGSDPKKWYLYSEVAELQQCSETLVFSFAVDQQLDSKHTKGMFRACVADYGSAPATKRASPSTAGCSVVYPSKINATVELGRVGPSSSSDASRDAAIAGSQISQHIRSKMSTCASNTVSFGSSGRTLVGLYAGSQVLSQGVAEHVLDEFVSVAEKKGLSDKTVFQLCGSKDRGADFSIGIAVSLSYDVSFIQRTVKAWNNGACAPDVGSTEKWADFTLQVPTAVTSSNRTRVRGLPRRSPPPSNSDGACTTKRVVAGDSCAALAAKCGISAADFTTINAGDNFCAALIPGQHVCCSRGTLPDFTPKAEPDGSCHAPPMPASVSNAVCGPTVPGTKKPSGGKNLTDLNPCPLKVCCNIWGQCGISSDFCVATNSETGAPGTAKPGTNGCIQNCGSDIIQSGPPKETLRIGYFGSWNANRHCLHLRADKIDTKAYTHIHFAFANITYDFKPDIGGVPDEFERFKKLTGVKKIISFGGWDFSTNAGTFRIIREAVKPANRNTFRDNVVKFVNGHGLDGFDLDWEYPGAPDTPGVPPSGDPQEGLNYYEFLSMAKSALGSGKSVSFAAPASYWYLKAFPIELMAKSLDYIVYMTYDLHGQWDYNNKWASSGCPEGNCLRSHVNLTETLLSLSMITKAGAPSNKVAVGITSYGRSFRMAQAGCDGPGCKFTGSSTHSDARAGMCTNTSGYIADAEIKDIINLSTANVKQWVDASDSNILVYNDVEWVAYMDKDTKYRRKKVYNSFHFAGTSDWALDLQEFQKIKGPLPLETPFPGFIDAIEADVDNIPWNCKHQYTVSAL